MTRFVFVVNDDFLRNQISLGLVPHIGIEHVRFYARRRAQMPDGTLHVLCVTSLPSDVDIRAVDDARRFGKRLALIVQTEDRRKWDLLAALHEQLPFCLVIAIGGPREKIATMFKGATTVTDVSSLIEPGKQIADVLIRKAAENRDFVQA